MSKQQLSDEQKQELANAISKLSPEEQEQIAAAGCIPNDEVCQKLQHSIVDPAWLLITGYAAPMPRIDHSMLMKKLKEEKEWKDKHLESSDNV